MALNRREFIGALVTSATLGELTFPPSQAGATSPVGQEKWLRSGLIDGGGSHEPNSFLVRLGGRRLDDLQTNDYEESEKLIRPASRAGSRGLSYALV